MPPATVQTEGVVEANVTVNPAGAEALNTADPNAIPAEGAVKLIAGVASPTLMFCETEFPAYTVVAPVEAVTVHMPPIV